MLEGLCKCVKAYTRPACCDWMIGSGVSEAKTMFISFEDRPDSFLGIVYAAGSIS